MYIFIVLDGENMKKFRRTLQNILPGEIIDVGIYTYNDKVHLIDLSSGIYFYKLSVPAWPSQDGQAENYTSVKKMILMK